MGASNRGVTAGSRLPPPSEAFHLENKKKITGNMRGERNKGKEEREKMGRKGRGGKEKKKERGENGKRGKGKEGKGGRGRGKRQCCVQPVMLVEFVQIAGIFKV